jgi:hypothetical protein
MSLTKILRNIALGGTLLLSSLASPVFAQDSFPGGVGDSGLRDSEKHLKNKKKPEETKKEETPPPSTLPSKPPSSPSSSSGKKYFDQYIDRSSGSKSKRPNYYSFAWIDNYEPNHISLDTIISNRPSGHLSWDGWFDTPHVLLNIDIKAGIGLYSREISDKIDPDDNYLDMERSWKIGSIGFRLLPNLFKFSPGREILLGYNQSKRYFQFANSNIPEGKKIKDSFYLGFFGEAYYDSFSNSMFDTLEKGFEGGLSFLCNMRGVQFELDGFLSRQDHIRVSGYHDAMFFGGGATAKLYWPIVLKDETFIFLKAKVKGGAHEVRFRKSSELAFSKFVEGSARVGIGFNPSDKCTVAIGPMLDFDFNNYEGYDDNIPLGSEVNMFIGGFLSVNPEYVFFDFRAGHFSYRFNSGNFSGDNDSPYLSLSFGAKF